jgi:phosphoglycolate phosphatase
VFRLALFDIDCTLIDAHGAGGRAINRAIEDVYGVSGQLGDYSFHGRTDPGIIRDLVEMWGAEGPENLVSAAGGAAPPLVSELAGRTGEPPGLVEAKLDECIARYLEVLRDEIDGGRVDVLPGVHELVTALAADEGVLLGLLTGNVAEGASVKLGPTGLLPLFQVAAYGSDSPFRTDLPAVAVRRAEGLVGRRFAGKEIVVIGDTPADIECGEALGVKTVAVATGRHSAGELAEHAPDHLFSDLSDWRRVRAAILA